MRTTIVATLLALGMLAVVSPLAAAETVDVDTGATGLCAGADFHGGSYTIDAGVVTLTGATRWAYVNLDASVCL